MFFYSALAREQLPTVIAQHLIRDIHSDETMDFFARASYIQVRCMDA
jgi:hypothetical protein